MNSSCGHPLCWHGCYRDTFDLIAPDSYAHPAKMSPALCFCILEHLEELGLLKPNDTILDPMGGTGLTNICAGAKGYKTISVELEEKFIGFEKQNKEYAEHKLYKPLDWQILQGDSRKLSELLSERGLVTCTSPPYADLERRDRSIEPSGIKDTFPRGDKNISAGYKGMVTVSSPPYGEAINADKGGIDWKKAGRPDRLPENNPAPSVQGTQELRYSQDQGNIGNLPDKPLKSIMSPLYDGHKGHGGNDLTGIMTEKGLLPIYGHEEGQIGDTQSESYLSAMKQVYSEIAKVSDVLVLVLKNPTRNKQLRRLDLDTIAILKQAGWTIHCQHCAVLFEELEQGHLFGENIKKVKGHMSFFKRLSWQNGQPVASWEDIVIAVR